MTVEFNIFTYSSDAPRHGLRPLKDLNATSRRKSICKAGSARRALAKPPPYSQRPRDMVTNTYPTQGHILAIHVYDGLGIWAKVLL